MNRAILAVAISMWLTGGDASARTWGAWAAAEKDGPLRVTTQFGWSVEETVPGVAVSDRTLPRNRGYDGQVEIALRDGASEPDYPLRMRFMFEAILPADLTEADNAPVPHAGVRLGHPAAEIEWVINGPLPHVMPLIYPSGVHVVRHRRHHQTRRYREPGVIGRYEIVDVNGAQVARGRLPVRSAREQVRVLVGPDAGDEAVKQLMSRSVGVDLVHDLPDHPEAYRMVSGLWMTDALWERLAGREDIVRRLLLSGIGLAGAEPVIERVRSGLGVPSHGRLPTSTVQVGGTLGSSHSSGSFRSLDMDHEMVSRFGRSAFRRDVTRFENNRDLFERDRRLFLAWSLLWMGLFTVGVGWIMVRCFIRTKGARRVAIWWMLPCWAACAVIGVRGIGAIILNRQDRADITEYRVMVVGWPEMHCRVVANAMTFRSGRPTWRLPSDAVIYNQGGYYSATLDGYWKRFDEVRGVEGRRLQIERATPGNVLQLEAGWFEPAVAPVEMVMTEDDEHMIEVREPVDAIYLVKEGLWRATGPLKAGDRISAHKVPMYMDGWTRPSGLPRITQIAGRGKPCTTCAPGQCHRVVSGRDSAYEVTLVVWQRDTEPRVSPDWDNQHLKGRVIWIIQPL